MFKSNDESDYKNFNSDDTIIGHSIKIEGDLISDGSIIVEGEVAGSVKTAATLRVGDKAKITASVSAKDGYVAGQVVGNMDIADKLELSSSATVNGDISAKILLVESGAIINGKVTMSGVREIVNE